MRIFLIGSAGPLSVQPLRYLIRSSHNVCGVGVDGGNNTESQQPRETLIMQEAGSLASEAMTDGLPVTDLARPLMDVIAEVQSLCPDIVLVSCYARRLGEEWLDIAPMGAINIHPSLLPAFRGPLPVFWQFRSGADSFGLSLHRMTSELDAGPVLARKSVSMPDGISMPQANMRLAEAMPELIEAGLAMMENRQAGIPQDPAQASYQSFPAASDYTVSTQWSARRIYNFMRATAYQGQVYPCVVQDRTLRLQHALPIVEIF